MIDTGYSIYGGSRLTCSLSSEYIIYYNLAFQSIVIYTDSPQMYRIAAGGVASLTLLAVA